MRKAVIDMGTNTFHLLIVENSNGYQILHKEKQSVRIGKGGISKGTIAPDAVDRAIGTLKDFRSTLRKFEVNETIITATSAVRSAQNREEFINQVKTQTGFDIKVLSGIEEATMIYHGVNNFVQLDDQVSLIMDIGGGSIEFILANKDEIKWLKSYELGGQRLIDQFHHSDPIGLEEQRRLTEFLVDQLSDLFNQCKKYKANYLIGSSGSFDTFWDIYCEKSGKKTEKPKLNLNSFDEICHDLITKNRAERLAIPGMIPMRVDMIVGAAIVTKLVIEKCNLERIEISPFALKEGVLYHGLPKY